jgi:peptide chain release factor 2
MRVLRARLFEVELEKKRAETQSIEDSKLDIAWGSQIRSYVFQPYTQVKDHRTDVVTSDVQGVMDGVLEPFVDAYLRKKETA